jgi:Sulfotransferase family
MAQTPTGPILVTGAQRSGTTWVGKMIASHPGVVYVWEPFNKQLPHTPARHWYHHVTAGEEGRFREFLRYYLTFQSRWADVRDPIYPRRILRAAKRATECWWRRRQGCRALMKDPNALCSAEWLAEAFGMSVVVLIRHPAAFVSSYKRLGWVFYFQELWAQPQLMEEYLEPFRDEIRWQVEHSPPDLIDSAILLWRVLHHVILDLQRRHPHWAFVRHEDLSLWPVEEFLRLFEHVGLDMTPGVRRAIERHSSPKNPREAGDKVVHQLNRDSRGNVWNWRGRLSPLEIARVRKGTQDVARWFYTDADWQEEHVPALAGPTHGASPGCAA